MVRVFRQGVCTSMLLQCHLRTQQLIVQIVGIKFIKLSAQGHIFFLIALTPLAVITMLVETSLIKD
ncbi:hypothetical protein NIES23_62440 (plasmid) [Trichormus variabilis NIES-23]|uniref:Uncharacterized protein n=1 Tax=Trichormus variabilis NIES-23 TaxID=1973479 RepID=A0A1Z4KWQ6_ANAVA|nr:hypothetical protein NIES23_62440 [Trichormus variabilis NIES-23]